MAPLATGELSGEVSPPAGSTVTVNDDGVTPAIVKSAWLAATLPAAVQIGDQRRRDWPQVRRHPPQRVRLRRRGLSARTADGMQGGAIWRWRKHLGTESLAAKGDGTAALRWRAVDR
jgi:hypothetical protein